jgi:hypothetical protein
MEIRILAGDSLTHQRVPTIGPTTRIFLPLVYGAVTDNVSMLLRPPPVPDVRVSRTSPTGPNSLQLC